MNLATYDRMVAEATVIKKLGNTYDLLKYLIKRYPKRSSYNLQGTLGFAKGFLRGIAARKNLR